MDNINNLIKRRTDVDAQNINLKDSGKCFASFSLKFLQNYLYIQAVDLSG